MIKHNEYWFVTVPSMAFGFDINNYGTESELMFMIDMGDIDPEFESDESLITQKLPPGNWQLIGLASELEHSYLQMIGFDEVAFTHGLKENTTVILKLI